MAKEIRASWIGTLSIPTMGVDLPLKLAPASSEDKIELKMLCQDHLSTVEGVFQCNMGGEIVERSDLGRALVYQGMHNGALKEHVVPLDSKKLAGLREELDQEFVITETRSIYDFDPARIQQSYRCWTDPVFQSTWASLWRAMDRLQLMAYGRLFLADRLYAAALRPSGRKEFTVYRLHFEEEMRPALAISEERADPKRTQAFMKTLEALRKREADPVLPEITNRYNEGLKKLISEQEQSFFDRLSRV